MHFYRSWVYEIKATSRGNFITIYYSTLGMMLLPKITMGTLVSRSLDTLDESIPI